MKAIRIHEDGGPEVLRYEDAPDPCRARARCSSSSGPPRSTTSTSGSARGSPPCRSRGSSAPTARAWSRRSARASTASRAGDRVVINPGLDDGAAHRRRAHGRDARRARRRPGRLRPPTSRTRSPSRRRPRSRSSSRPPTGCSSPRAAPPGGRVGARLGDRQRRRHRLLPDREGARRAGDRHLVERREARAARASSARTRPSTTRAATSPRRVKEATGGKGADVVVEHVGEATWKTSLAVAAPDGRVVVCGATSGPNPPAQLHRIWWKQLTILGSTMGTREDFPARLRAGQERARDADRRLGVPARRGGRGARAARERPAARQDRPLDPVGPIRSGCRAHGRLGTRPCDRR